MSNNTETISPRWAGFHRLWIIVAIIPFLLLLLLWLLGYGPNGKKCVVPPTIVEKIVEQQVEVDSPKLLSRIGSLEKENSGIKGLQAKIVELQNKAPTIKTVEKLVTAPDTLAPRLGIKGSSTMSMLVGESFTDEGVIALDNIDNKVDVKVTGKVDTNTAGEYVLTYTATDAAGNTSTETRKVIVEAPARDETPPRLSLVGSAMEKISAGEKYVDTGATAMDNVGGKTDVKVTGNVDVNKPGTYTLTYTSTDTAGNTSTVKRKVIVEAPLAVAKLYFDLDSAEFPADTELSLSTVISHLKTHSSSMAIISGFHDPSGNKAHNEQLAYDRAIAVRDLLQQSGITPDRIELKKPEQTTGTGAPEEARRVEVSVTK